MIRPAATTIVLRPGPDGRPHVYLTQRHERMRFLANYIAFPGGLLDDVDRDEAWPQFVRGLTPVEASEQLDAAPAEAFSFWIAALRELCEEAGLIPACDADGQPVDLSPALRQQWQDELNAGTASFLDLVRSHGLKLDLGKVYYFDRRVGPPGRREQFDTRYFLTALPHNQEGIPCPREISRAFWLEPAEALAAWERRELRMVPPTVATLRALSEFDDVDSLMRAAATPGSLRMPSFPPYF